MSTVDAFDAKTHFSELLKKVEQGGQVTITKHGRPVAKLLPAQELTKENICLSIQKILDFSKFHNLGNLDWKELKDEGRRNEF
jgi:prevent-host-death family protein